MSGRRGSSAEPAGAWRSAVWTVVELGDQSAAVELDLRVGGGCHAVGPPGAGDGVAAAFTEADAEHAKWLVRILVQHLGDEKSIMVRDVLP